MPLVKCSWWILQSNKSANFHFPLVRRIIQIINSNLRQNK